MRLLYAEMWNRLGNTHNGALFGKMMVLAKMAKITSLIREKKYLYLWTGNPLHIFGMKVEKNTLVICGFHD